jgi:hypothetical protein
VERAGSRRGLPGSSGAAAPLSGTDLNRIAKSQLTCA